MYRDAKNELSNTTKQLNDNYMNFEQKINIKIQENNISNDNNTKTAIDKLGRSFKEDTAFINGKINTLFEEGLKNKKELDGHKNQMDVIDESINLLRDSLEDHGDILGKLNQLYNRLNDDKLNDDQLNNNQLNNNQLNNNQLNNQSFLNDEIDIFDNNQSNDNHKYQQQIGKDDVGEDIKDKIKEITETITQIKNDIKDNNEKYDSLSKKYDDLLSDHESINKKLLKYIETNDEKLNNNDKLMNEKLAKYESDNDETKKQIEKNKLDFYNLKSDLYKYVDQKITDLTNEIKLQQNNNDVLKNELAKHIEENKSEFKKMFDSFEKNMRDIESNKEISDKIENIIESLKKIEKIEKIYGEHENKINDVYKNIGDLKKECADLHKINNNTIEGFVKKVDDSLLDINKKIGDLEKNNIDSLNNISESKKIYDDIIYIRDIISNILNAPNKNFKNNKENKENRNTDLSYTQKKISLLNQKINKNNHDHHNDQINRIYTE